KVKGDAEEAKIDSNRFRDIDFRECLVGEEARRTMEVENFGGYPFDFDIRTNYPIKVTPSKGQIPGNSKQIFTVSWIPTGGYAMKSTVHVIAASTKVYDF